MKRLLVICTFLLIGMIKSAKAEMIPASSFACNYFFTEWTCMGYELSYADFLADYTTHVQAIPEGMATCILNCDYPFLSTATGFYREAGVIRFGDLTSFQSDYVSLLPVELKTAVDDTSTLIEPQFYDAISLAMVTAAPDSVYLGELGQFSLQNDSVAFTGNIIGNPDAIGYVGNQILGTTAATGGYTYISTVPATKSGILKSVSFRVQSGTFPNDVSLHFMTKTGTNSFKTDIRLGGISIATGINTIYIYTGSFGYVTSTEETPGIEQKFVITAGQYIGIFTPTTIRLSQSVSSTNPRRYRVTGNPAWGATSTGTLQNYATYVYADIHAPPLEVVPGLTVVDNWTWEGEGHIKLQWHTGNICYKKRKVAMIMISLSDSCKWENWIMAVLSIVNWVIGILISG